MTHGLTGWQAPERAATRPLLRARAVVHATGQALRVAASVAVWMVLGGCQTTTTTTTTSGSPMTAADRERGSSTDPRDLERRAAVRLELAGLYFGRGQLPIALDEVRRAMAVKADMPEAYALRGLIYAGMGEIAQADDSFKRALQLAPRDGDTLHNYGWFLCQQQRHAEAEAHFALALAQPQYREPVRTLLAQGVCHANAGRWADAERTLTRSYELDPTSPVTAYNLSTVLLQRGELDRARFYVARINVVPEYATAQSLWLATRIERRLGNQQSVQDLGRQLRERFPQSTETLQFERGRFDD